jgi:tight adherence protein B
MEFGGDLSELAFMAMVALAVGGLALTVIFTFFNTSEQQKRVNQITTGKKDEQRVTFRARFQEDSKDSRRRQIQDSLNKQIQDDEKIRKKKKRLTLRTLISQAGIELSVKAFWIMSIVSGIALTAIPMFLGAPVFVAALGGFVGLLGLPRWFLGMLRRRRQNTFLNDFADAIDVMVRGLKAGLPVSEAMKIIASESGPPVGPEFLDVVDGQKIGISIDQGIERMSERMPLSEVSFLGIVMAIQSKTGGNLSEALGNLSRVLRERKKMKAKIRSVSQEAKSSAAIIGSLPFVITGALLVLNPNYLNPMFDTSLGNMLIVGSGMWMSLGVLIMRKMINFEI